MCGREARAIRKKKDAKEILKRVELKVALAVEGIVDEAAKMLGRFGSDEDAEPSAKTLAELMAMLEKARKVTKGEDGEEGGVVELESCVPRPSIGEVGEDAPD